MNRYTWTDTHEPLHANRYTWTVTHEPMHVNWFAWTVSWPLHYMLAISSQPIHMKSKWSTLITHKPFLVNRGTFFFKRAHIRIDCFKRAVAHKPMRIDRCSYTRTASSSPLQTSRFTWTVTHEPVHFCIICFKPAVAHKPMRMNRYSYTQTAWS